MKRKIKTLGIGCLIGLSLVACAKPELEVDKKGTETKVEIKESIEIPGTTVYGEIGNVKITRKDIEEELKIAEYNIVVNYIQKYLDKEFYGEYLPTEEELTAKVDTIKSTFGAVSESVWLSYLSRTGYTSEEEYKEALKSTLAREKMIEERLGEIEIVEEIEEGKKQEPTQLTRKEIEEYYQENENNLNYLLIDYINFDLETEYDTAIKMAKEGKTYEEIKEAFPEAEEKKDEKVLLNYDLFLDKPTKEYTEGEIAITDPEQGIFFIAQVKNKVDSYEKAEEQVIKKIKEEKLQNIIDHERALQYEKYKDKVKISGEEYVKELQEDLLEPVDLTPQEQPEQPEEQPEQPKQPEEQQTEPQERP